MPAVNSKTVNIQLQFPPLKYIITGMSGQAGAARREKYYVIEYLSGVYENIAVPRGEEGTDYIGRIFREHSRPYERVLARVIPALNEYFEALAGGSGIPLVPYSDTGLWLDGIVRDDTLPGAACRKTPPVSRTDGAAYVRVRVNIGHFFTDYVSIDIMVQCPVGRSALDGIAAKIKEIFDAVRPCGGS